MPIFGPRGAYTCARCELRQLLLRRNGLKPASLSLTARQRRNQSAKIPYTPPLDGQINPSEIIESTERRYAIKSFKPAGMVGRRGRRTERSEHLKIKSLDKASEVIILRELPDYMHRKPRDQKQGNDRGDIEPEVVGPTAQDIQKSLSEKRQPTGDEIIAAIDQHRPVELVLSQAEYDRVSASLADSYLSSQLRFYLRKRLPIENLTTGNFGTKAKSRIRTKDGAREEPSIVPPNPDDVTRLNISPWRASSGKFDTGSKSSTATKVTRHRISTTGKAAMLNALLKQVWGIQTEEENERRGKLEISLSPQQWGLLNTREDETLFASLRTGKFFQRTRFNRDPKKGALIIRGPRIEAEQVGKLFASAFAGASSSTINLTALRDILSKQGLHTFDVRFTQRKLQEIMYMTKTFIHFDKNRLLLEVAGFHKDLVEDATRLLVIMLDLPKRVTRHRIVLPIETNLLGWEPMHVAKALPSRARFEQYYRRRHRELRSKPRNMHEQLSSQNDLGLAMAEVGRQMKLIDEATTIKSKYWKKTRSITPWTAKYGLLLDTMPLPSNPDSLSNQKDLPTEPNAQFASNVPALTTILSGFERMTTTELQEQPSVEPRLVARLIPSPFAASRKASYQSLPMIDMEFTISRKDISRASHFLRDNASGHDALSEVESAMETARERPIMSKAINNIPPSDLKMATIEKMAQLDAKDPVYHMPYSSDIDDFNKLTLTSVRVIMGETTIDVSLPAKVVDLRFTSKSVVEGKIDALMANPEIKQFVNSIMSSMQHGKELRAPPSVNIPLDRSMIAAQASSTLAEKNDIVHPYFFAGFQHSEMRRLRGKKEHVPRGIARLRGGWTISDIEGGYGGGRCIELSAQMLPEHGALTEKDKSIFIERAFSMADFIHDAHVGLWKPVLGQTDAGKSREKSGVENGVFEKVDSPFEGALQEQVVKSSIMENKDEGNPFPEAESGFGNDWPFVEDEPPSENEEQRRHATAVDN